MHAQRSESTQFMQLCTPTGSATWQQLSLYAAAAAAAHVSSEPSFSKMRIAIVGALPVVLLQASKQQVLSGHVAA
jgi:hypothetical protein